MLIHAVVKIASVNNKVRSRGIELTFGQCFGKKRSRQCDQIENFDEYRSSPIVKRSFSGVDGNGREAFVEVIQEALAVCVDCTRRIKVDAWHKVGSG